MKSADIVMLSSVCVLLLSPAVQTEAADAASLKNDPARCEEFMDWGVGMFIVGNGDSKISVLGKNDKVVEYHGNIDATSKMEQTEDGLKISVVRAQRIYNNGRWPNPIVVKLEGVEFMPAPQALDTGEQ